MISGAYQIVNEVNGKCYVGSSKDIRCRWRQWRNVAKRESLPYRCKLHTAFRKYGIENFTFIVLEECESTKEALEATEQKHIDNLKPAYNIKPKAYSNLGYKHLPESIERMRTTLKSGRSGGHQTVKNGTNVFQNGNIKHESRMKIAEINHRNGLYERMLPEMCELARSEKAIAKRKLSYQEIGHQQGVNNSQYGTCWITDGSVNKKIKKTDLELYIGSGYTKGRRK